MSFIKNKIAEIDSQIDKLKKEKIRLQAQESKPKEQVSEEQKKLFIQHIIG